APLSANRKLLDKIDYLEKRILDLEGKGFCPGPSSSSNSSGGSSRERSTPSPSQPSPSTTSSERRSQHRGASSRGDVVPGANMVWNNDPIAIANFQIPPSDLTPRLRKDLIGGFLRNRDKCYFDLHVGRFIASLSLPPADPKAPHPALVDAILLVACYFSRAPYLVGYESGLLAAANTNLSTSFHRNDRLHDFIRASNLISFYYFCKGMYPEAYQQIISSCHVTVTCGLHQIPSPAWTPVGRREDDNRFLSYPADGVEQGERIYTFWQVFCLHRMISMAVSLPTHLPGGPNLDPFPQILTAWPRLLYEYENGAVFDMDAKSVAQLFLNQTSTLPGRLETLDSLRCQGYALVYKADHLLSEQAACIGPSPQEILITDGAIQTFMSRLPHLRNSGDCGEIPANAGLPVINYRIVTIHTLAHVASLILHQHGADVSARRRCTRAAQGIAAVIGQLTDADYSELFIGLGYLWYMAGQILLTITANANGSVAEQYRSWALVVISALKKISMVYRPLGKLVLHMYRSSKL
ncbi:hypothetical protein FRC01_003813, partial [Tulasnella sp. 417]